jgi:hypothetical protein
MSVPSGVQIEAWETITIALWLFEGRLEECLQVVQWTFGPGPFSFSYSSELAATRDDETVICFLAPSLWNFDHGHTFFIVQSSQVLFLDAIGNITKDIIENVTRRTSMAYEKSIKRMYIATIAGTNQTGKSIAMFQANCRRNKRGGFETNNAAAILPTLAQRPSLEFKQ